MAGAIDFIGRYDHLLDAKNRLMIPQVYRENVQRASEPVEFHVTRGFDECLYMYTLSTWDKMKALLEARKADEFSNPKSRKFLRWFYSSAVEVTPDKAGRVLIPDHLRQLGKLKKKVVLIGVGDRIEIWDSDTWLEFSRTEDGEYEKAASEAFGGET